MYQNLKKNLVSISAMEDKGFNVAFTDGKVRMWKKSFKEAITIGFRVDTLYQVGGSPLGAMTSDTMAPEVWTVSLQIPSRSKVGGDQDARVLK